IVRPLKSTAETQPQLQSALLRLSAIISQYFTRVAFCLFCSHATGAATSADHRARPHVPGASCRTLSLDFAEILRANGPHRVETAPRWNHFLLLDRRFNQTPFEAVVMERA